MKNFSNLIALGVLSAGLTANAFASTTSEQASGPAAAVQLMNAAQGAWATAGAFISSAGSYLASIIPAAEASGSPGQQPAVKNVDVEAITAKLKAKFPNTQIRNVRASEIAGLFEVITASNVAYTDAGGRYLIFGSMFDVDNNVDITARSKEQSVRVEFPSKLLANAIKTVRGDGSRVFALFSDPQCTYCHQLEKELPKLDNVTIYTFLYPILPGSVEKAISIWCAADRNAAWSAWMADGQAPALTSCENPINDNIVLGGALGIKGTPNLVSIDGRLLPGAAPADRINDWLNRTGRDTLAAAGGK